MSNFVNVARFRRLDYGDIRFYDDLYRIDNESNAVTFTADGAAYYGSWFRRFGFAFDSIDADTFIATVRDIGRLLFDSMPDDPAQTPEQAALWALLDEGRFDEFTAGLLNAAEEARRDSASRVVALRSASAKSCATK